MMSQQTIFVDREDKNSGSKAADMIVRAPKRVDEACIRFFYMSGSVSDLRLRRCYRLHRTRSRAMTAGRASWCIPRATRATAARSAASRRVSSLKPRFLFPSLTPVRLLSQLGPFQPGLPVQPMVISYARNRRMDPCWVEPAGLPVHIVAARLLLQFHNHMEARRRVHHSKLIVNLAF